MENDMAVLLNRIISIEERIGILEKNAAISASPIGVKNTAKKIALTEFIKDKKPAGDVQKTLAIGFYLEKFLNLTSFNAGDLEQAFTRAKETKPLNMNDKVNMNIRGGYMDEATDKKDGRKAWYLTTTGEQYVENNFKSRSQK